MLTPAELAHFDAFGFVVLRGALDPGPLAEELERALADGCRGSFTGEAAHVSGRYLPMMCERTPVSLALLDHFMVAAAELLGAAVLPGRAKGVHYFAASDWHRDSERTLPSVGFAAYLAPLHADNGALRVLPGSHRPAFAAAIRDYLGPGRATTELPGLALATVPGDVIAFDERLIHASFGGRDRRQWRVDYIVDPSDAVTEAGVRAWYAETFPPDWDGGYDSESYPTYGPTWQASGRPCLARLEALGAHAAAAVQEANARAGRPAQA